LTTRRLLAIFGLQRRMIPPRQTGIVIVHIRPLAALLPHSSTIWSRAFLAAISKNRLGE
jgi:hypothetical protein